MRDYSLLVGDELVIQDYIRLTWKKPIVEKISKAKSDLEDLYARVSPLLRDHPAEANYFSDELWRILEELGRLKMTLSSSDLPECTLTISECT
jgi:hypothetical protein